MLNFINENYDRHIITLEDPIEYYHKHKKCTVNQREIGVDVPDFKEGIRRALRMDPDIILVGEMRDLETIHAAIEAAETGHVVFGTLHTSGASSTINRIIDVFPQGAAGPDPHAALDGADRRAVADAVAEEARGRGRRLRDDGGDAGHPEPDPREQDLPHRLQHPDRPQARHVPAGREPVPAVAATACATRKKCCCGPPSRPSWPPRSPRPSAASTTRTRTKTRRGRRGGRGRRRRGTTPRGGSRGDGKGERPA